MKLAFRVDSSPHIGSGHFRRCLVLAKEARVLGLETVFISAFLSPAEQKILFEGGHALARLDVLPTSTWSTARNPDWNSLIAIQDELQDADETSRLLGKLSADYVILDHYFLTQRWVDRVRSSSADRFLVIEDLDREWDDIEFVVNGNLDQTVALYPGSRAVALSGGRYALLSGEYRLLRNQILLPPSARQQITVFVGGSDSRNLTSLLLTEVLEVCRDDWPIEVVVGAFSEHLESIHRLVVGSRHITLTTNKPSMADAYSRTRLALGAGGVSAWERACMGVPSILLSIAPNQVPVCEALSRAGGAIYLGSAEDVSRQQISNSIENLNSSPDLLDEFAQAGSLAIDGYGAKRVIQIACTGTSNKLELREAKYFDCEILFSWFNDPSTRSNSLNQDQVSWPDHKRWFYAKLSSERVHQFILESYGLPVGQVRLEDEGGTFLLSYSIDRDFRGRGYGHAIVELGVAAGLKMKSCPIRAIVKKHNEASIRILQSLDFIQYDSKASDTFEFVLDQ